MTPIKPFQAFILVLASMLLALATACSPVSTAENLDNARHAINREDYASARSICDEIRHNIAGSTSPDVNALCQISLIYMMLADRTGNDDNVDYASQCYIKAYETDSVATDSFYTDLPLEHVGHAMLLRSIVQRMDPATATQPVFTDDPAPEAISHDGHEIH